MVKWSLCPDVESNPDVTSGVRVIKGTRVPVKAVLDNADDGYTAEQIASEIYDSLPVELTRRVIAFARQAKVAVPWS
ncbi:MAG: DUF433 domain-containing protein [Acidobacteriaceae bacterium]